MFGIKIILYSFIRLSKYFLVQADLLGVNVKARQPVTPLRYRRINNSPAVNNLQSVDDINLPMDKLDIQTASSPNLLVTMQNAAQKTTEQYVFNSF